MMVIDPRALIADGRKHDEAMTDGPWEAPTHLSDYGANAIVTTDDDKQVADAYDNTRWMADQCRDNALGIAWLRTNLAALLDGYTSALDEVERLKADIVAADERMAGVLDGTFSVGDGTAQREIERLRTSIGEQSLVIEQQDRDMARLKQRIKDQDEELQANAERAYRILTGAPCTTK